MTTRSTAANSQAADGTPIDRPGLEALAAACRREPSMGRTLRMMADSWYDRAFQDVPRSELVAEGRRIDRIVDGLLGPHQAGEGYEEPARRWRAAHDDRVDRDE